MNDRRIWPRPQIVPLPQSTRGIDSPRISLNGVGWKVSFAPQEGFTEKDADVGGWQDTPVPMQLAPPSDDFDGEYAYAYTLRIPEQWQGNRLFLRFDGVNCYARVFVDGHFAGDHYGGFVSWDCEITAYAKPGGKHRLIVGATDKHRDVNPFHLGGIIRDVTLFALPQTYLARLHAETFFDETYINADLEIHTRLESRDAASILLSLTDPNGKEIPLGEVQASGGEDICVRYPISAPQKWDSEHPYLYTLTAKVMQDGVCVEAATIKVGFRQIKIKGNQMFINGDLLKLRGFNRHDIHPVTGRALTRELVEEDVRLFKEANVNFIRTSHYPPRPDFLELCDEYGIYVEDEIALSFIGQGVDCRENDPKFTDKFLGQFSEMIERDRSHPCVILWSLANECFWGTNFALLNAYAHQEDPGRPTIFSYPITQREDDDRADVWSMHYAAWGQDPTALVDSFGRSRHEPVIWPVLHDECTHIPCYSRTDLRRDPGIRDFWGETISRFWDILWETPGALGCAVWAGLDDVWFHPRRSYPGPPWGIIDGWRRRKPEYWHARKAYSLIRLTGRPYALGDCTALQLENRFNHTNMSEVSIAWQLGGQSGNIQGPDLKSREKGELVIPVAFQSRRKLELAFTDAFGNLVDEAIYFLDAAAPSLPRLTAGAPLLNETPDEVLIEGDDFSLAFSRITGLITKGYRGGELVVTGGPTLHLTGLALAPWSLESIKFGVAQDDIVQCGVAQGDIVQCGVAQGCVQIQIQGCYGKVRVEFIIRVDRSGLMETAYTLLDMPYPSPRMVAMRIGDDTDSGGYEEVGVSFTVPQSMDTLSWKKTGLWNVYPDWHIARLEGSAGKTNPNGRPGSVYEKPRWGWELDELDTVIFGKYDIGRRGTRDFSSMKANILSASISCGAWGQAFAALSDGTDCVRMEPTFNPGRIVSDRNPRLEYKGEWIARDTKHRSMGGTETWSNTEGDTCTLRFLGTGCAFVSSFDTIGGIARAYVDGKLMDDSISLGVRLLTSGVARGYEKDYGRVVYSIQDLPLCEHTITIEVAGKRAPGFMGTPGSMGEYVFIDHFIVFDGNEMGDTRFIINSEFNYPELSWGCYTKPPVTVSTGYSKKVYTRLGR